jgi:cytochrome c553
MAAFKGRPGPPVDEVFDRVLSRSKQDSRASTHQERVNMRGVAHAVKSEQIKQALDWYAIQLRRQGHSGDKALVALGKSLFMNGLPEQRQFACMTCHGPDAQGNRKAPRLAGQNAEYIVGQLLRFRRAESNNEPEMLAVARALNPAQVRAAAAYLQSR